MLYKVKRTGTPHFAVETPMLAAVVKGTTFTVAVDDERAAVQVTEGVVEVSSENGLARRLVEGGMTVYIGRERPNEIIEVKSNSPAISGASGGAGPAVKIEGSGDVSLTTITNLTNGLLREAATTPVVAGAAVQPAANIVSTAAGTTPTADSPEPSSGLTDTVLQETDLAVTDVVQDTVTAVTQPVDNVVQVVPAVTDPVVNIVETVVPVVINPVVDIVETVVPAVTDPVLDIVETVVPVVTDPVVDIVETVVPVVTDPVVDIVETVVPVVTDPVVDLVDAVIPGPICVLLCGR